MQIEKKLKDAREHAKLTQEQVAQTVMVSRQTISNWENGKSLPDIISVIKLSQLYNISVDELLKSDQKMQEKIEKDANIAKINTAVILVTAAITLAALAVYLVSSFVGDPFRDFCENAIRWILFAVGVTFALTFLINRNRNHKFECIKGVFKMKKLQIAAIILLLLGIWFCFAPILPHSNLPALASIASVVLGLICGVVSMFVSDK